MANPTNDFGQYVPAGCYQITSQNISITLSADCQTSRGNIIRSSVTFNADATIHDIANIEGQLTIS